MSLPGVSQLEATPQIFRLLLDGITPAQAQWKPAPGRFSIAELLEHLSHVEGHDFRAKVEAIVSEENPELPVYDQERYFAEGVYSGRDAEDSFDHWEEQREDNLAYLHNLNAQAAKRVGNHAELRQITLAHLLNEWAMHDLGHIRQLAELVRAVVYYPESGPYQSVYTLRP